MKCTWKHLSLKISTWFACWDISAKFSYLPRYAWLFSTIKNKWGKVSGKFWILKISQVFSKTFNLRQLRKFWRHTWLKEPLRSNCFMSFCYKRRCHCNWEILPAKWNDIFKFHFSRLLKILKAPRLDKQILNLGLYLV